MSYPTGGSYSTPYSSPLGAPGSGQSIGVAPVTPPGNGAAATSGFFALAAAACAGVSYAMGPERYATGEEKTSILIAIIAAALGGVLALARMRIGVAIAIGAVTAFIAEALFLSIAWFDIDTIFDPTEVKLTGIAGALGLIVVFAGLFALGGRINRVVAAIIAALAITWGVLILPIADDVEPSAVKAGVIVGAMSIAVIMAIGALIGRYGSAIPFVAALTAGPVAIYRAQNETSDESVHQWRLVLLIAIAALSIVQFAITTIALRREAAARDAALQSPPPQAAPVGGVAAAFVATPAAAPAQPAPPADNTWAMFGDTAPAAAPVAAAAATPEPEPVAPPAPPASVPAGWAPDPYGRHEMRYWDGAKWTDEVYSAGARGTDPI
jgi:hypothetical protein